MALVFGSVLVVVGCTAAAPSANIDADAAPSAEETSILQTTPAEYSPEDLAFVTDVAALLRGGEQLNELVSSRSVDDGVLALAQWDESRQMQLGVAQALAAQWRENTGSNADTALASLTGAADRDTIARLSALRADDFDREWLEAVGTLRRRTLEAANSEVAEGRNADARGLALQMVPSEQAAIDEIDQMKMRIGDG